MNQGKRKWTIHAVEFFAALIAFSIARMIGDTGSSIGFISTIQGFCVLAMIYCSVQASRAKD
jgi:hypothetical protein